MQCIRTYVYIRTYICVCYVCMSVCTYFCADQHESEHLFLHVWTVHALCHKNIPSFHVLFPAGSTDNEGYCTAKEGQSQER